MSSPHTAHPYAVAATSHEARKTRPREGRAAVDRPEAARMALAAAFAEGPAAAETLLAPGTALLYEARSRDDWELNTLFMDHDDYVFHPAEPSEGGPEFSREYFGVEGYIKAMNHFAESWSDLKVGAGPVKALDESRALSVMNWRAQGIKSGMKVEWTAVALFQFREGLIVDQGFWWSLDSARRDLGDTIPAAW